MNNLPHWLPVVLGTLAALCSMASFAPQVIKICREKDASAVSFQMCAVTVAGFVLWVLYGLTLKSWPLVASNSVCVVLSAAVLMLKLRYRGRAPKTGR